MSGSGYDAGAFNAFEREGWKGRARGYQRFFEPVTGRLIDPLLSAAGVDAGSRVLDVATGPGHVAASAARRGAVVAGLDYSEDMLALARRRSAEVAFLRGDAEHLPVPDGCLDAVVGNFVILHLGQPEQAVAEFFRVLRPGGGLALTTWDTPDRSRMPGLFPEAIEAAGAVAPGQIPAGPAFFRFAEDAEFDRLLRGAGFGDVQVDTVAFSQHLDTVDDLWEGVIEGTVRTRAAVLAHPEETQARIRAAFERLASPFAGPAGLELPVSVKVASGRKVAAGEAGGERSSP